MVVVHVCVLDDLITRFLFCLTGIVPIALSRVFAVRETTRRRPPLSYAAKPRTGSGG